MPQPPTPTPAQTPAQTRLQRLRQRYRSGQALLRGRWLAPSTGARHARRLLRQHSDLTDMLLRRLWALAQMPPALALVAVGGYGRAQLFPHSDVDLLVLLPNQSSSDAQTQAAQDAAIERFIGYCWDAGVEVGSSVRSIAENLSAAAADITIQTALLEARWLCGDQPLFQDFEAQFAAHLDVKAFFLAKTLELQQRHTRYDNSAYQLEPNCKEAPGGLRDLHLITWLARAAQLGNSWADLARSGLATAHEAQQLEHNEALLMLLRARLHALTGRRQDSLLFDLQTSLAENFGYRSTSADGQLLHMRASEVLMRRYYWAAKAVLQLSQILLLCIEERITPTQQALRPINPRFYDKAGRIEVARDDLFQRQPQAILETFLLYARHNGLRDLSARTLRALYSARGQMNAAFRRDPVNRASFMQILREPEGITHALRLMNQTSVLGRYLWAFRRIVGRMQHDLFHAYTVDQHSLMVLRNMRRFFIAEHAHEYPFCSQLASGWDKPWILYLAALFHDIGKGRGGDHSVIGALEMQRFCRQHAAQDISAEDAQLLQFLVAEHLRMSQVAQKQDLSDPEVIAQFAQRVGSPRHLTALYLLTVADIRGTSPKVWSSWKGKLLEDLYHATLAHLGGRQPDPGATIEARKQQALRLLALGALPPQAQEPLWQTLGVSYFMRHEAADIAWHTRQLWQHVASASPQVSARPLTDTEGIEGLQVLVYAPDAPDLFARICGYFDQAGYSILQARIHTAHNGYALDSFHVISTSADVAYRDLCGFVESGLHQALHPEEPLRQPNQRRLSRRAQSFPISPRVSLRPDEKAQHWVLTISASDRAGLLYRIARVLARHGISVQLAKISTLDERVEDSFLIHGNSLQSSSLQLQIEKELVQELQAL